MRTTLHRDGTLIQAWASHKSFRAKDDPTRWRRWRETFHGHKRSTNHESIHRPDARLYKRATGKEVASGVSGTRWWRPHGLIAAAMVRKPTDTRARGALADAFKRNKRDSKRRITVGADKAFDTKDSSRCAAS